MGILSNNSKIGDKGKDLILQTSGKVYVQVRDKFYPINFRETQKENTSDDEKTSDTKGVLIVEMMKRIKMRKKKKLLRLFL